jgi:hypothetical protein
MKHISTFPKCGPDMSNLCLRFRQVSPLSNHGIRSTQISMVAAASSVAQNPFRPATKPYTLPNKLRPEFTWMLPEDGMNLEQRLDHYFAIGEIKVYCMTSGSFLTRHNDLLRNISGSRQRNFEELVAQLPRSLQELSLQGIRSRRVLRAFGKRAASAPDATPAPPALPPSH